MFCGCSTEFGAPPNEKVCPVCMGMPGVLPVLNQFLRYAEVSDARMEEGKMRCDVNVSVRPRGAEKLGVKVEIKNLNSFRFVQKAIDFEIGRQIEIVESGGRVTQDTHLWDPV